MKGKNRQHYVSQGYLRNFSPTMPKYSKEKEYLTDRQRKKRRERMKIHYYNIKEDRLGFGNINKIATDESYFPKEINGEIQQIEIRLKILREIMEIGKEETLYVNDNEHKLWEIANCFRSKSRTFRDIITDYQSTRLEKLNENNAGRIFLEQTIGTPELFQTLYFTNDPDIVLEDFWVSSRKTNNKWITKEVSDNKIDSKEREKLENALIKLKTQKMIQEDVYPILIKNCTSYPFITGDDSVVANGYVPQGMRKIIYNYYFPISPKYAIRFLHTKKQSTFFERKIIDEYEIYKMNKLIHNCSRFFLFANEEKILRLISLVPKEMQIEDVCNAHRWRFS